MGKVPTEGGPVLGENVSDWYDIPGLIDSRRELAWAENGGPSGREALSSKRRIVVHFNGPSMDRRRGDLELMRGVADYHLQRNWGTGFPPVRGNGCMYHFMIARDGLPHLTRTAEMWSWHATASWANRRAIAVFLPLGGDQEMSRDQSAGLERFCDAWLAARGGDRGDVYGHGDVFSTECPGPALRRWLLAYWAKGDEEMADVRYFAETGFSVGGAFLEHWQRTGGLMMHGFPLTDEFDVADAGAVEGRRTVQVFERSVFEWWPENDEPYRVLQRRLGADVVDDVLAERVE